MTCKYRVAVSIDGGGKYGLVPLRFLSFLEEQLNELMPKGHVSNWVDLYAATSTSTIIAGALAVSGVNGRYHYPSEILHMYNNRGKHFFDQPKSKYSVQPLNYVLEHFFGDLKLSQIQKHFLFVSYNLDADEPFIFSDSQHMIQHCPISKMMQACSASPGFLDSVVIANKRLADGMLTTKNPAKLAFQYARVFYPEDPIILISIGTGISVEPTADELQAESVHIEMQELARQQDKLLYFRFNPTLCPESTSSNEHLVKATDQYIDNYQPQVERLLHLMEIKAGHLL